MYLTSFGVCFCVMTFVCIRKIVMLEKMGPNLGIFTVTESVLFVTV